MRLSSWLYVSVTTLSMTAFAVEGHSATINKIATDGAPARIEFQHLKSNDAGDFIGISNMNVFVGNAHEQKMEKIFTADRSDFVLTASTSFNLNNQTYSIDVDILQTRVDLNSRGDFVVASNTLLWVGNTKTKAIRQVASAGAFAEFQTVQINDAGQYVAMAYKKIIAGDVADEIATELISEATGNFSIYGLYASNLYATGEVGETRLALNKNGRFIALTGRAVYHGDIAAKTATVLYQEAAAGFRHVSLKDDDSFTIVAAKDVYVGNVAP